MNNFFDLYFYKSTNNTNDKLKEIRESNSNTNIALLSIIQNNGKGRSGKVWLSNKGDLTCSFLINQSLPFKNLGRINMIIINVLFNFFKNFKTLSNIKYKWPNDIQINGKKISGILIETFSNERNIESFIIGLGINLVSSPKIKLNKTISLAKLNINIDPVDVFFLLKKEVSFFFKKFEYLDFLSLSRNLNNNFYNKNTKLKIKVKDKVISGNFKKINTNGELVLDTLHNKNYKVSFGEII